MQRCILHQSTVEEGNFVLEYNFVQQKVYAHLFIIVEGKKNF